MNKKELKSWTKVLLEDLGYVSFELRQAITTPAFILLEGELGAGKTTFAKTFCEQTSSPTYSVLSEHQDILHGDFYRIKNREEIIHLELPLYLENKNYFLLEWGKEFFNLVAKEIPEEFSSYILEISINKLNDSRNFVLSEIIED